MSTFVNHPAISPISSNHWLLSRLKHQMSKHPSLIIGVDFDNTIRSTDGTYYQDVINLVIKAYKQGHTICIWTANKFPLEVQADLALLGIHYDYFNDSPLPGWDSRKPHFNILLDDIAGLNEAYNTLNHLLDS